MSHNPEVAQAYRDIKTMRRWRKERLTDRWRLAQVAAIDKFPLNGTSACFKSPEQHHIGKRRLVKGV